MAALKTVQLKSTLIPPKNDPEIAAMLLAWFDQSTQNGTTRPMPWREVRDPYRVLLSEFMLQQTQVATVIPYYENFLKNWPTLTDLALADEQAVLKAWEGLGYYSRARNLLAAARQVVDLFAGQIPESEIDLLKLKGVGDYTAGAIRSIAYNQPAAAVDGNVVRVASRLTCTAWEPGDLKQRRDVKSYILSIQPPDRPGDFNEALMDLGATICLPKSPRCMDCPLQNTCQAALTAAVTDYPKRKVKPASPVEYRTCLIYRCGDLIHVKKRPAKGLLAGLYEFDWAGENVTPPDSRCLGEKRHVFTHRIWQMTAYLIDLDTIESGPPGGQWADMQTLHNLPFPTALADWRKLVVVALQGTC